MAVTDPENDDYDEKDKIPGDGDSSEESHILSLSDRQAVFSGRKIHLTPFRAHTESEQDAPGSISSSEENVGSEWVEHTLSDPVETADKFVGDDVASCDETADSSSETIQADDVPDRSSGLVHRGVDESGSEGVVVSSEASDEIQIGEGECPFVFDFLSGTQRSEEPVDSFVAGLQSVFAVRDESDDDSSLSESTGNGDPSTPIDPYSAEEVDDDFYTDESLSPDEEYQEDERQRQQESLDGVLRQNDADLLYELGEKYGLSTGERVEESPRARITPTSILEAMLFVGDRENRPLNLRVATDLMRNVSEEEAKSSIQTLNRQYEKNGAPYRIEEFEKGWRMVLRPEFESVRDRFLGRTRQKRLPQKTIEVLALVAYRQPISTAEILEIRPGAAPILSQLLKRDLIVQEKRVVEKKTISYFRTTDRFLSVFNIASLADLPVVDEVDYR